MPTIVPTSAHLNTETLENMELVSNLKRGNTGTHESDLKRGKHQNTGTQLSNITTVEARQKIPSGVRQM